MTGGRESAPTVALRNTSLAMLGVVGKLFLLKKELLTCGEHELSPANCHAPEVQEHFIEDIKRRNHSTPQAATGPI
jgi:hypothetical protein